MDTKGIIENKLRAYGQEQLLTFWDELSEEQKAFLEGEINRVDFEQIQRLFEHRNDVPESSQMAYRCSEPVSFRLSDLRERVDSPPFPNSQYDPYEAREIGEGMLRHGRIAAAVVAGGQGTRLDFPHAKGFYPIGPLSNASLFQIHAERIRAVARKYNTRIPFLIQTSPATHDETITFFREHKNFGLPDEDVLIFCQGTMPSVRFEDGKIFLREKWEVAKAPTGMAVSWPVPTRRLPTPGPRNPAKRGFSPIWKAAALRRSSTSRSTTRSSISPRRSSSATTCSAAPNSPARWFARSTRKTASAIWSWSTGVSR
ncbi:MAG: UTP--glucose-1-phosphate uridylyltransferase [Thermoguttaceae bacterium]|nr:UTP--glucose-1-phosphate uridylyltransferase [Thermoguttaceae bacterium]